MLVERQEFVEKFGTRGNFENSYTKLEFYYKFYLRKLGKIYMKFENSRDVRKLQKEKKKKDEC